MSDCASQCGGHDAFPRFAGAARVASNREIAPAVYEIVVDRATGNPAQAAASAGKSGTGFVPAPVAGQFFMLRARPSGVLLGRPISVYRSDEFTITFLVLKKGRGTEELCGLRNGDSLDLVGPIGNRFILPSEVIPALPSSPRVALIGGGIGVAPVAGFSLGLPERSFDFYASFRSAPYGLDLVEGRAANLFVTTEDGSAGTRGMLPAVFDASRYDVAYACGPTPMLRYVKQACSGIRCFISLEEHMACGAGACLGCTVRTTAGNKRCCVDGPVFDASEVSL